MPKREILILDKEEGPWRSFLEEFFNDTLADCHSFEDASRAGQYLLKHSPNLVFVNDKLLSPALAQKLKALREFDDSKRLFQISTGPSLSGTLLYDFSFEEPIGFTDFQTKLVQYLPFPETLKLLVVDDEDEIGRMFLDRLKDFRRPAFHVEYQSDGKKGLAFLERHQPDVMVSDVKMPEMTGIELYRQIKKRGWTFPVIFFFDAIFGDEVIEIHKIGVPAIVEKGSRESQVQGMASLILKMYYFA